ncbi:hypothetical protein NYO91_07255 [Arhodomonas aquaeolei]|uniref:hypothetical protein n=1 Tax=Arhodomonas aquaeolei TaxID=2369 RepID=UPI00216A2BBD|nr:hypothetical protein [Arhodomonas aquaeolei]MCS4503873.1 hypothetical protein [Arhodomonas aquaeolei]
MAEGETDKQAPDWFQEVVAEGIAKLYVLRLDSAPAADTLDGVEMVWVEALWHCGKQWDEAADYERLRRAFVALTQRVDRWPAPKQLLENLPPRPQPKSLPQPKPTPEERERAQAFVRRMREIVAGMKTGGGRDGAD